jgi:hypothetical protein
MAGDLLTLANRMKQIRRDLPDRVTNLTIEVVEQTVEGLVSSPPEGTPVDESVALSNWQVSVDKPKRSFIPAHSPGTKGSTARSSAANVMVAALAALRSRKPGQPIYISNNAPYIRRLAYEGHSKQSPPGWVEGTVLRARKWLQKQRGRLLK